MQSEITNLLPIDRQHAIARDYVMRLGVVGAALLCVLMLTAIMLLIPTYVYLTKSANAKEARLASMEAALSSVDEKELSARLAALTRDASVLTALADAPSASDSIRSAFEIPRPGISLTGFSYTPFGKTPRTLTITGKATTRDALRSYQLALQEAPFASQATLPVSAYAKDADIGFTITVTFKP